MSEKIVASGFGQVKAKSGGNRKREAKVARSRQLFSVPKSIEYLGSPTDEVLATWARGEDYTSPIVGTIGPKTPAKLACILCGGTHTIKEPRNAALVTLFRFAKDVAGHKAGEVFAVSDTCKAQYLKGLPARVGDDKSGSLFQHALANLPDAVALGE